jgi:hypothetical protein
MKARPLRPRQMRALMTWMQVRAGGFNGDVSKKFSVTVIPATFSIDADCVLEDQHATRILKAS